MITIVQQTKIDFLGKRVFAFFLSAVMIALGLYALIQVGTGQANLGIDFAGGTAVQLKFEKPVDLSLTRARACQSAVARTGKPVMIGFNRRFDPHFQKVYNMVRAGKRAV